MKIAMFGHKHFPSREGGIEVVVRELAKRMSKTEQLTIYDRYELDGGKRCRKKHRNMTLCLSPTLSDSRLNAVVASFFSTIQCCLGNHDIVHIHAEGPSFFCWMLKLFRKKVVVTIHGIDWQRAKWGKFAKWYLRIGERMAARYADRIIVLSEGMHDYFKETYGRETYVIPNGVSISRNTGHDRIDRYGIMEDGYILYLGRLVPEKRVELLIKAYKELNVGKKLVIAGPIEDTEYVNHLMELAKGNEDIVFTGFVSGVALEQMYTNSSLFVLPSDIEGMSISLLEAMGYGIRCLTSDIPENRSILQPFGSFFKAGDKESLKAGILGAMDEKPEFNQEQEAYVHNNHDWDSVAAKTLSIYEDIVRGK